MREAVVALFVFDTRVVHAPGEPVVAVETDLNGEGESGLNAQHMHQPELVIEDIGILAKTFAHTVAKPWTLLSIAKPEAVAGLHAAQNTDEPFFNGLFCEHLAGEFLSFVCANLSDKSTAALSVSPTLP